MTYRAVKTDHTIDGADMAEHIVELVEAKAGAEGCDGGGTG